MADRDVGDIFDPSLFVPTSGFMSARCGWDLRAAKAAVLGIPYDCGIHPTRVGSRLGPASIREQSALVRVYELPDQDFDPLSRLGLVDCGNVCLTPATGPEAQDKIEQAMVRILENGCIPLTMGGDGAVTLPQLRAVRRYHDDLVVLHIDAHTDTYPIPGELDWQRFNTGTTFTHAANEGLVDPRGSWHIGARGPTYLPDAYATARALGYTVVTNAELRARGIEAVVKEVKTSLAGRPVYLCWDMDVFDPSCAPGVCTPTWGGLSAAEGLSMLRSLAGLGMVAFDVNTVGPPHDSAGMTAFLAASCMREALFLACASLESRGALA